MRGKNVRQPFSTGSCLKPVLNVPLLHLFVAQTGAKASLPFSPGSSHEMVQKRGPLAPV
jgi:hypothetical protein